MKEDLFSTEQVCEYLGITIWTLNNWYSWQKKLIDEKCTEEYLPIPYRMQHEKGKPKRLLSGKLEAPVSCSLF